MSSEWKTFSELQAKYGVLRKAHYLLDRKATRQLDLLREARQAIEHGYHSRTLLERIEKELGDER